MKKNKPRVVVNGKVVAWNRILMLVADDLGLTRCQTKANRLAQLVCEQQGWAYTGYKEILQRRGAELVGSGAVVTRKKKIAPIAGQSTRNSFAKLGPPHPNYVKDPDFYKSREWREIRLYVLDLQRVCQACGASSSDCRLHVDHIIPRYKAPHLSLTISNLQCLCEDCNYGKGAWSEADFRHFKSI